MSFKNKSSFSTFRDVILIIRFNIHYLLVILYIFYFLIVKSKIKDKTYFLKHILQTTFYHLIVITLLTIIYSKTYFLKHVIKKMFYKACIATDVLFYNLKGLYANAWFMLMLNMFCKTCFKPQQYLYITYAYICLTKN